MATLVARFAEKLISSRLCRGMESKEPIKIFASQKKEKGVAMATLVARCCRKANHLQSVQGYGKQRTHKIFISPRNREKVLPLPGVAAKINARIWNAKIPEKKF